MQRAQLDAYLDQYLEVARFRDYCPNGLQVEGRGAIDRVVTGVSASIELIDAAIEARADAVLVHHGYFWRGEDPRITSVRRRRLANHAQGVIGYSLIVNRAQPLAISVPSTNNE